MAANLVLIAMGVWGLWYTWTKRSRAGAEMYFDRASPTTHPIAYRFTIGLRLLIFAACLCIGGYRLVVGIVS